MLVDWEMHARDCVAKLRLAHSRHVDDPWFNELIRLLRARSPEFAAWWDEHNVQLPGDGVKVYDHPESGRLTFEYALPLRSSTVCALAMQLRNSPRPRTGQWPT
jgi:hypothetical protein